MLRLIAQSSIFNIMNRKYNKHAHFSIQQICSFLTFSIDLQQIGTLQSLEKAKQPKNFQSTVFKDTLNISFPIRLSI